MMFLIVKLFQQIASLHNMQIVLIFAYHYAQSLKIILEIQVPNYV